MFLPKSWSQRTDGSRRLQGKAQAQTYQRSLLEMERHRRRLELEHGELMSRVQYLAEEVRSLFASGKRPV